jgi:hypothetical protein
MATSTYTWRKCNIVQQKAIEDRINAKRLQRKFTPRSKIKGVENLQSISILKVAVSEDVQNCSDRI